MASVETGMLNGAIPYLAVGDGPPLVMAMGLTATHEVPTGAERRMVLRIAMPLSSDFRVLRGQPEARAAPGHVDVGDRRAPEHRHRGGVRWGGAPHRHQHRWVGGVAAGRRSSRPRPSVWSSHRPTGSVRAAGSCSKSWRGSPGPGTPRSRVGPLMTAMVPSPVQRPMAPLVRRLAGSMAPEDPTDMLVTVDAEDAFDVGEVLHRISAPTLVIGGGRDAFYPRELFEQTAAGVQDGRAHIHPDWGHLRTSGSAATANITLGFLLAALT
jgi:hypothetical protein